MATQKDDTIGYYLALGLFSLAIPVIAAVGYWMAWNMRDQDRPILQLQAPPAAEAPAAPAAE